MDEVDSVFNKGAKNRATSSTNLNASSSRSHLITLVEVTVEENEGTTVKGRLFLVDLAGSERVAKSDAKGQVLKEAQHINKSLAALGDVMQALDQKQKHIPFRNSKLTYLLQNALGGNSKAIMIFTVCPTDLTSEETLFTLQFAQRVRNISLSTAQRNISAKNLEISVKMIKSELRETKKKKHSLEELIVEMKRDYKKALEKANGPLEGKIKTLEEHKRINELNIYNLTKQIQDLSTKIDEEKNSKQQTLFDLELTQRNLKRALEISKEYTHENDRLSNLVKNKEAELDALKEAVTKTILSPPKKLSSSSSASSHTDGSDSPSGNSSSASVNMRRASSESDVNRQRKQLQLTQEDDEEDEDDRTYSQEAKNSNTIALKKLMHSSEVQTQTEEDRRASSSSPPGMKSVSSSCSPPVAGMFLFFSLFSFFLLKFACFLEFNLLETASPMSVSSPFTRRLSNSKIMTPIVLSTSVNSILSDLDIQEVEEVIIDRKLDSSAASSSFSSSSIFPNTTHKKIERKPAVPRQSHSASWSSASFAAASSSDDNQKSLRRVDSHNSMHSATTSSSRSSSASTTGRFSSRSQDALKKHQVRYSCSISFTRYLSFLLATHGTKKFSWCIKGQNLLGLTLLCSFSSSVFCRDFIFILSVLVCVFVLPICACF
jgi:hypothetical protein